MNKVEVKSNRANFTSMKVFNEKHFQLCSQANNQESMHAFTSIIILTAAVAKTPPPLPTTKTWTILKQMLIILHKSKVKTIKFLSVDAKDSAKTNIHLWMYTRWPQSIALTLLTFFIVILIVGRNLPDICDQITKCPSLSPYQYSIELFQENYLSSHF